jgi:hypothetical protein
MENCGGKIPLMKWGAHTLGAFTPNVFTFTLLGFRFL